MAQMLEIQAALEQEQQQLVSATKRRRLAPILGAALLLFTAAVLFMTHSQAAAVAFAVLYGAGLLFSLWVAVFNGFVAGFALGFSAPKSFAAAQGEIVSAEYSEGMIPSPTGVGPPLPGLRLHLVWRFSVDGTEFGGRKIIHAPPHARWQPSRWSTGPRTIYYKRSNPAVSAPDTEWIGFSRTALCLAGVCLAGLLVTEALS